MMLCQYRFIGCSKCTTLVGDVDNEGSYACVEAGAMWEVSVLSSQFRCAPKSALKDSLLVKEMKNSKKELSYKLSNAADLAVSNWKLCHYTKKYKTWRSSRVHGSSCYTSTF